MTLTSPGRGENTKGQGNREQVDGFNEKEQQLYNFGTSISIGWHKKTQTPKQLLGEEEEYSGWGNQGLENI